MCSVAVRSGAPPLTSVTFLLEGAPGTGKTTIALHFLIEGARLGEKGLYITRSETEEELREGAASHGWTLGENIEVFEPVPPESLLDANQQQSMLYSSDLELGETTTRTFEVVEEAQASRVVLDSLSEICLLAQGALRYRRQVLALKHSQPPQAKGERWRSLLVEGVALRESWSRRRRGYFVGSNSRISVESPSERPALQARAAPFVGSAASDQERRA